MFTRHTLYGLRTLVPCTPELRSLHPSSKLPWLYEGQCMQATLPGVLHHCKIFSALAVLERPWRIHSSAVALSHHPRETPCSTTYGNDMLDNFCVASSSDVCPTRVPTSRWLSIAWAGIGAKRGSHSCMSRSMAERPSSRLMSWHDNLFLEKLRLCREYVSHR